MGKNKSVKNSLIIAVVILAVTALFLTINYVRTKKNIENFNTVVGKNEKVGFSQVLQTILNDNKFGTTEENARYSTMSPKKGVIEIKEKMFISQVNDINLNFKDYLGKTIKLEGIFKNEKSYDGDQYCFVIRYGPGCCGNDGIVGFEIKWDENNAKPYPKTDSWVESTGVLKQYEADGYTDYLYLDLISLNVLNKRGAETVVQ